MDFPDDEWPDDWPWPTADDVHDHKHKPKPPWLVRLEIINNILVDWPRLDPAVREQLLERAEMLGGRGPAEE